jgi:hypothetical protein
VEDGQSVLSVHVPATPLCEACYSGGRGFNSCDQGQLGVHRQHEAGGAGGGEGEEETEGEEERRYYGED